MIWQYICRVLQDLLTMIYQYAGVSIIVTIFFVIVWKQAEKTSWKDVWKHLIIQLKDKVWQKRLLSVLYIVFVLQRTVFNRSPWGNPLGNILGVWGLSVDGVPNYEMYENVMLFIPMYWAVKTLGIKKQVKHWERCDLWNVVVIPLEISLVIEIVQLMLRVGTFQLSDLVYNTVGGLIGGIIYCIVYFLKRKKDKSNFYG